MEYNEPQLRPKGPVSVGEWVLTMLIMVIPLVNLIMLFVWAFGDGAKPSKANWAKASLIWMLIGFVVAILLWSTIAALIFGASGF